MSRAILFLTLTLSLAACTSVGPGSFRGTWQMSLALDRGGAYFARATIDRPIYVFEDGGGGVFYWCRDEGFTRCDREPSGGVKVGHYQDELIVVFSQGNYSVISGRDSNDTVENGVITGRGSLLEGGSSVADGDFHFSRIDDNL